MSQNPFFKNENDTWHRWHLTPKLKKMTVLPWKKLNGFYLNPAMGWMLSKYLSSKPWQKLNDYHVLPFSPLFEGRFSKKNQEKLKKNLNMYRVMVQHRPNFASWFKKKCNSFKSSAYGNYQKFHHQCSLCRISAHLHPLLGVCRDWHPIHLHHLCLPRFHLRSRITRRFTCG